MRSIDTVGTSIGSLGTMKVGYAVGVAGNTVAAAVTEGPVPADAVPANAMETKSAANVTRARPRRDTRPR